MGLRKRTYAAWRHFVPGVRGDLRAEAAVTAVLPTRLSTVSPATA